MCGSVGRAVLVFSLSLSPPLVLPQMTFTQPLLSVYYPDFIAANQEKRADDILPGKNTVAHVEKGRREVKWKGAMLRH